MTKASAAMLAIIFCSLGGLPAMAFDGTTDSVGGSGGAPFASPCRPGEALVEMSYRSGKDLDTVTPECALLSDGIPSPEANTRTPRGTELNNGGQYWTGEIVCPVGMVVQQVHASKSAAQLVHQFWFTCRNLVTGAHADTAVSGTRGGTGGRPGYADCGGDSYAVGLSGRVVAPVSALGLICATYHPVAPPPPPAAPPPPLKKPPLTVDNGTPPMTVDNGDD